MAKKVKNPKLLRPTAENPSTSANSSKPAQSKSVFNSFAQRLQIAKNKKIQKAKDAKNRLMSTKKQNKILRERVLPSHLHKGNKANKFALLQQPDADAPESNKLTHRGVSVDKIKHFHDINYDNQQSDPNFQQVQGDLNFHGFDQTEKNDDPERRKSKNQIYKQIIQKSKMHKRDRQQQYQQNFNTAVELDEKFNQFVGNLKFRNNDKKVRDRLEKKDNQYEKLMNQLKEEERVVANRVVDNNKKGVEKIRKKKNVQLNELMRDDGEEEEDIRGWVKGVDDSEEEGSEGSEGSEGDGSDQEGSEEEDDEIDQVALSSGDEEEEEGEGGNIVIEEESDSDQGEQGQEEAEQGQSQQEDDLGEDSQQEEQQEEQSPPKPTKNNKKIHKPMPHKPTPHSNSRKPRK